MNGTFNSSWEVDASSGTLTVSSPESGWEKEKAYDTLHWNDTSPKGIKECKKALTQMTHIVGLIISQPSKWRTKEPSKYSNIRRLQLTNYQTAYLATSFEHLTTLEITSTLNAPSHELWDGAESFLDRNTRLQALKLSNFHISNVITTDYTTVKPTPMAAYISSKYSRALQQQILHLSKRCTTFNALYFMGLKYEDFIQLLPYEPLPPHIITLVFDYCEFQSSKSNIGPWLKLLLSIAPDVQIIQISKCKSLWAEKGKHVDEAFHVLNQLPNLQMLYLPDLERGLPKIFAKSQFTTISGHMRLKLIQMSYFELEKKLQRLTSLTYLNLSNNPGLLGVPELNLPPSMTSLVLTASVIHATTFSQLSQLRQLKLQGPNTCIYASHFTQLQNLQHLQLYDVLPPFGFFTELTADRRKTNEADCLNVSLDFPHERPSSQVLREIHYLRTKKRIFIERFSSNNLTQRECDWLGLGSSVDLQYQKSPRISHVPVMDNMDKLDVFGRIHKDNPPLTAYQLSEDEWSGYLRQKLLANIEIAHVPFIHIISDYARRIPVGRTKTGDLGHANRPPHVIRSPSAVEAKQYYESDRQNPLQQFWGLSVKAASGLLDWKHLTDDHMLQTDMFGRTLLHAACRGGHLKVVRMLVERFPTCLAYNPAALSTPLHAAAFYNHFDIVNYLLTHQGTIFDVPNAAGKRFYDEFCNDIPNFLIKQEMGFSVANWPSKQNLATEVLEQNQREEAKGTKLQTILERTVEGHLQRVSLLSLLPQLIIAPNSSRTYS